MSFFNYAKSTEVPFNTKNVLSENKTNMSLELNGMSKLNNSVLTIIAWGSEKGRGHWNLKQRHLPTPTQDLPNPPNLNSQLYRHD